MNELDYPTSAFLESKIEITEMLAPKSFKPDKVIRTRKQWEILKSISQLLKETALRNTTMVIPHPKWTSGEGRHHPSTSTRKITDLLDPVTAMTQLSIERGGLLGHPCTTVGAISGRKSKRQFKETAAVASLLLSASKSTLNMLTHNCRFSEKGGQLFEYDVMGYSIEPPNLDTRLRSAALRQIVEEYTNNQCRISAETARLLLPLEPTSDPKKILEPRFKSLIGQQRMIGTDAKVLDLEKENPKTTSQKILVHNLLAAGSAAPLMLDPEETDGKLGERPSIATHNWAVKYHTKWECACMKDTANPEVHYDIFRHTVTVDEESPRMEPDSYDVPKNLKGHTVPCYSCGNVSLTCISIETTHNDTIFIFCDPSRRSDECEAGTIINIPERYMIAGTLTEAEGNVKISIPNCDKEITKGIRTVQIDEEGQSKWTKKSKQDDSERPSIVILHSMRSLESATNNHIVIERKNIRHNAKVTDIALEAGIMDSSNSSFSKEMTRWWSKAFPGNPRSMMPDWSTVDVGDSLKEKTNPPETRNPPPMVIAMLTLLNQTIKEREATEKRNSKIAPPCIWTLGEPIICPKSSEFDLPKDLLANFRQNEKKKDVRVEAIKLFQTNSNVEEWKEIRNKATRELFGMKVTQGIEMSPAQLAFYTQRPAFFTRRAPKNPNEIRWETDVKDGRPSEPNPRPLESSDGKDTIWKALSLEAWDFSTGPGPTETPIQEITTLANPAEIKDYKANLQDPTKSDPSMVTTSMIREKLKSRSSPPVKERETLNTQAPVRIPDTEVDNRLVMTTHEARSFLFRTEKWNEIRKVSASIVTTAPDHARSLATTWGRSELLEDSNFSKGGEQENEDYATITTLAHRDTAEDRLTFVKLDALGYNEESFCTPEDMIDEILWKTTYSMAARLLEREGHLRPSFVKNRDPVALTVIGYPRILDICEDRVQVECLTKLRTLVLPKIAKKKPTWAKNNFSLEKWRNDPLHEELKELFIETMTGNLAPNRNYQLEIFLNWLIVETETIDAEYGHRGPLIDETNYPNELMSSLDPVKLRESILSNNHSEENTTTPTQWSKPQIVPIAEPTRQPNRESIWSYTRALRDLLEVYSLTATERLSSDSLKGTPDIRSSTNTRYATNLKLIEWLTGGGHQLGGHHEDDKDKILREEKAILARHIIKLLELSDMRTSTDLTKYIDKCSIDTLRDPRTTEKLMKGKWMENSLRQNNFSLYCSTGILPQARENTSFHANFIFGGRDAHHKSVDNDEVLPDPTKLLDLDPESAEFLKEAKGIAGQFFKERHPSHSSPRARALRYTMIKAFQECRERLDRDMVESSRARPIGRCIARMILEEAIQHDSFDKEPQEVRSTQVAVIERPEPVESPVFIKRAKLNAHDTTGRDRVNRSIRQRLAYKLSYPILLTNSARYIHKTQRPLVFDAQAMKSFSEISGSSQNFGTRMFKAIQGHRRAFKKEDHEPIHEKRERSLGLTDEKGYQSSSECTDSSTPSAMAPPSKALDERNDGTYAKQQSELKICVEEVEKEIEKLQETLYTYVIEGIGGASEPTVNRQFMKIIKIFGVVNNICNELPITTSHQSIREGEWRQKLIETRKLALAVMLAKTDIPLRFKEIKYLWSWFSYLEGRSEDAEETTHLLEETCHASARNTLQKGTEEAKKLQEELAQEEEDGEEKPKKKRDKAWEDQKLLNPPKEEKKPLRVTHSNLIPPGREGIVELSKRDFNQISHQPEQEEGASKSQETAEAETEKRLRPTDPKVVQDEILDMVEYEESEFLRDVNRNRRSCLQKAIHFRHFARKMQIEFEATTLTTEESAILAKRLYDELKSMAVGETNPSERQSEKSALLARFEAVMRGFDNISDRQCLLRSLKGMYRHIVNELCEKATTRYEEVFSSDVTTARAKSRFLLELENARDSTEPWHEALSKVKDSEMNSHGERMFSVNRAKFELKKIRLKTLGLIRTTHLIKTAIEDSVYPARKDHVEKLLKNSSVFIDEANRAILICTAISHKEYPIERDNKENLLAISEIEKIVHSLRDFLEPAQNWFAEEDQSVNPTDWEKDVYNLIDNHMGKFLKALEDYERLESVDYMLAKQYGTTVSPFILSGTINSYRTENHGTIADHSLIANPRLGKTTGIEATKIIHSTSKDDLTISTFLPDDKEEAPELSGSWTHIKFDLSFQRVEPKSGIPPEAYLPDFTPSYDIYFRKGHLQTLPASYRLKPFDQGQLFPFDQLPMTEAFYDVQEKEMGSKLRGYWVTETRINAICTLKMRRMADTLDASTKRMRGQVLKDIQRPEELNILYNRVPDQYKSTSTEDTYVDHLRTRGNTVGTHPPRLFPSVQVLDDGSLFCPAYRSREGKTDLICISTIRRPCWERLGPQEISLLLGYVMARDLGYRTPLPRFINSSRSWKKMTPKEDDPFYAIPYEPARETNTWSLCRELRERVKENNLKHEATMASWAKSGALDYHTCKETSWNALLLRGEAEIEALEVHRELAKTAEHIHSASITSKLYGGIGQAAEKRRTVKCDDPYPIESRRRTVGILAEELLTNFHTMASHMRVTQITPPDISHLAETIEATRPAGGGCDYSLWFLDRLCFGAAFIYLTAASKNADLTKSYEELDGDTKNQKISIDQVKNHPLNPKLIDILGWLNQEKDDNIGWGRIDWVRVVEEELNGERLRPLLKNGAVIPLEVGDDELFSLNEHPHLLNPFSLIDEEKLLRFLQTDAGRLIGTPVAIRADHINKQKHGEEIHPTYSSSHLDVLNGMTTLDQAAEEIEEPTPKGEAPVIPIIEPACVHGQGNSLISLVREATSADTASARREAATLKMNGFTDHAFPENLKWWEEILKNYFIHHDHFPVEWQIAKGEKDPDNLQDDIAYDEAETKNISRVIWFLTRKRFLQLASIPAHKTASNDVRMIARGIKTRRDEILTKCAEYFSGETYVPPIGLTTALEPTFGETRAPIMLPVKNSQLWTLGSHVLGKDGTNSLQALCQRVSQQTIHQQAVGNQKTERILSGKRHSKPAYANDSVEHIQSTPLAAPPYHGHLTKVYIVDHFLSMMRRRPVLQTLLRTPYMEAGSAQTRREMVDTIRKILQLGEYSAKRASEGLNILREFSGERGAQDFSKWKDCKEYRDKLSHPILSDDRYLPFAQHDDKEPDAKHIAQMALVFRNFEDRESDMKGQQKFLPAERFYDLSNSDGVKTTLDLIGLVSSAGSARWSKELPELQHRVRTTAGRGVVDIDITEDGDRVTDQIDKEDEFSWQLRVLQDWAKVVSTDSILYQAFHGGIKVERNSECPDVDKAGSASWEQASTFSTAPKDFHLMHADEVARAITNILIADMVDQSAVRPLLWFFKMSQIAKAAWFEGKTALLSGGVPNQGDLVPMMGETPKLLQGTKIQSFWYLAKIAAPELALRKKYKSEEYFTRPHGKGRHQYGQQFLPLVGRIPTGDDNSPYQEYEPIGRQPVLGDLNAIATNEASDPGSTTWTKDWVDREILKNTGKTFASSSIGKTGDLTAAVKRMKLLLTKQYYTAAEESKSNSRPLANLLSMWYIEDIAWPETLLRVCKPGELANTTTVKPCHGRVKELRKEDHDMRHAILIHSYNYTESHDEAKADLQKACLNRIPFQRERMAAYEAGKELIETNAKLDKTLERGMYISGRDHSFAIVHRSPAIYDKLIAGCNYTREFAELTKHSFQVRETLRCQDADGRENAEAIALWMTDTVTRLAKMDRAIDRFQQAFGRVPHGADADIPFVIEEGGPSETIRGRARHPSHKLPEIPGLDQWQLMVDPIYPDCVWIKSDFREHALIAESRQCEASNYMNNRGSLHLFLDSAMQHVLPHESRTGIPRILLGDDKEDSVVIAKDKKSLNTHHSSFIELYDPMDSADCCGESTALRIKEVADSSEVTNIRELVSASLLCPSDGVSPPDRRKSGGGHPRLENLLSTMREIRLCIITGQDPQLLYRSTTRYDNHRLDKLLRLTEDARKARARWSNPVAGETNPGNGKLLETPDHAPIIPQIINLVARKGQIHPATTDEEILLAPNRHIIASGRNLLAESRQGIDIQRAEVKKMSPSLIKHMIGMSTGSSSDQKLARPEWTNDKVRSICKTVHNSTPRASAVSHVIKTKEDITRRIIWYRTVLSTGMPYEFSTDPQARDLPKTTRTWIPSSEPRPGAISPQALSLATPAEDPPTTGTEADRVAWLKENFPRVEFPEDMSKICQLPATKLPNTTASKRNTNAILSSVTKNRDYWSTSAFLNFSIATKRQWKDTINEMLLDHYPFARERRAAQLSGKTPEGPCFVPVNAPRFVQVKGFSVLKARQISKLNLRESRHHSYEYVQVTPRPNCIQEERSWQGPHATVFWKAGSSATSSHNCCFQYYAHEGMYRSNMLVTAPRQDLSFEARTSIETPLGLVDLVKGLIIPESLTEQLRDTLSKIVKLAEKESSRLPTKFTPRNSKLIHWERRFAQEYINAGVHYLRGLKSRHQNVIDHFRVNSDGKSLTTYVEMYDEDLRQDMLAFERDSNETLRSARHLQDPSIDPNDIVRTFVCPLALGAKTYAEKDSTVTPTDRDRRAKIGVDAREIVVTDRTHATQPIHYSKRYVQEDNSAILISASLSKRLLTNSKFIEPYSGIQYCPLSESPVVGSWPMICEYAIEDQENWYGSEYMMLKKTKVNWRAAANAIEDTLGRYISSHEEDTDQGNVHKFFIRNNQDYDELAFEQQDKDFSGEVELQPGVKPLEKYFAKELVFTNDECSWAEEGEPTERWFKSHSSTDMTDQVEEADDPQLVEDMAEDDEDAIEGTEPEEFEYE